MSVADVLQEIETRRAEALQRRISAYPRQNPIASDISECPRETALGVLHWDYRPLPDPDLKARFERGSLIENAVIQELLGLGITVRAERTPFEIKDKKGRIILRGKVDGFIAQDHHDYPMEVKSLNPNVFQGLHSLDDFQKYHWATKYPRQLQAYLYANNLEEGFFLIDDCLGHWKLIPVGLDYDAVENILRQCEEAIDAVESIRGGASEEQSLPPYHSDPAVCRRCWAFGRVCFPPIESQGITILADPELEEKLERWSQLKPGAAEYERLDKEIKDTAKGRDGLVVGRWLIQGKEIVRHMAAQPARDISTWKTKIVAVDGDQQRDGAEEE